MGRVDRPANAASSSHKRRSSSDCGKEGRGEETGRNRSGSRGDDMLVTVVGATILGRQNVNGED